MNDIRRFRLEKTKIKLFVIVFLIVTFLGGSIYIIDAIMAPAIISASDIETRAKVTEVVNTVIVNKYSKEFDYNSIVNVEKDKDGNIVMIKADTLKMSKIASDVAVECQSELKNIGETGLKIPLGYILKNNLLAFIGPSITVKMFPIGYIETKYLSDFESAGINQTRHKIYVQVKTTMRVIVPFNGKEIEMKNEVPISETIIVGKVPDTAINLGLDNAGFKISSGK